MLQEVEVSLAQRFPVQNTSNARDRTYVEVLVSPILTYRMSTSICILYTPKHLVAVLRVPFVARQREAKGNQPFRGLPLFQTRTYITPVRVAG